MICHCEICGEPFTTEHKRKYCEECRKMMAETSSHIRKEGLTYGQYVAKYGV